PGPAAQRDTVGGEIARRCVEVDGVELLRLGTLYAGDGRQPLERGPYGRFEHLELAFDLQMPGIRLVTGFRHSARSVPSVTPVKVNGRWIECHMKVNRALRMPAKFPGQVPRVAFRRERYGLLPTERGDALVVVGQETAIVGEGEFPSSIAT